VDAAEEHGLRKRHETRRRVYLSSPSGRRIVMGYHGGPSLLKQIRQAAFLPAKTTIPRFAYQCGALSR
jgi:hypothetical protein